MDKDITLEQIHEIVDCRDSYYVTNASMYTSANHKKKVREIVQESVAVMARQFAAIKWYRLLTK